MHDDKRAEQFCIADYRWGGAVTDGQPPASWPVSVRTIIADLEHALGHVPEELTSERAVRTFAMSCRIPVAEADIEDALFVHGDVKNHPRWASRAWLRAEYGKFFAWLRDTSWQSKSERLKRALAAA